MLNEENLRQIKELPTGNKTVMQSYTYCQHIGQTRSWYHQ